MQIRTFRQPSSESIGQWFYRNRRAIFIATMRTAVYSNISVAAYHIYTGGLSIFAFLKQYVFPIFQEVM
ncbi:hypothetical protein [Chamaesiphon minutus]|uniref:Uncharacterized protein n=1 Tax=Chamaesiphon minutus (strain ATCC 27169 / PCC 6605) TaxID=1173020 RepID=K9UDS8_CHAP6|nr:hypothetical protein [Chamaesiphon minutus]AFY92591.1 hypothetical protein Cha6605_1414 [Chamaesiphon minutus PCC 6605]